MDPLKAALPQTAIEDIASYLNADELSNLASTSHYYSSLCAGVSAHRDVVSKVAGAGGRGHGHDHDDSHRELDLISHNPPHRLGSAHLRDPKCLDFERQETIHELNELNEQFRSSFNLPESGVTGADDHFPSSGTATLADHDVSAPSSPATEAFDSHHSTDTEVTTPEEDEWEFTITSDLLRRLSKLPQQQQVNSGSSTTSSTPASLSTLPTELHLEIFSYLDQIDGCCLGLTSSRSYTLFRSTFGIKMPLTTRRKGPNTLERAWELVGKQECRHCGIYRCELHQHIKTWMPEDLEYCAFKNMFGEKAEEGRNQSCYRAKPSKPRRCGRHPLRTTSMHQDDSHLAMSKVF